MEIPEKYTTDQEWHDWYKREFYRKAGNLFDDPEDACQTAIARLLVEKLPNAQISNDRNIDGYVAAVFNNVIQDLVRERFGRARAPAKMKALGLPTERIYFEHISGRSVHEIADILSLPLETVKHWVDWLKANKKLPVVNRHVEYDDTDRAMNPDVIQDPSFDSVATDEVAALSEFLFGVNRSDTTDELSEETSTIQALRKKISSELSLTDEEKMHLRLRYVEAMTIHDAAARLNLSTSVLRNREDVLLAKIRSSLALAM